jgi:hypothetical protein
MSHFLQFFFAPDGKPWFEGAVWGNVVAVAPLAILGTVGYWIHRLFTREHERVNEKLERLHNAHSQHLKAILDALDPDTEGGIADVHAKLDAIKDEIDLETPGGIGEAIHTRLKGSP